MTATAWTVFQGDKPEPMEVEILGVLRGARGPGHDMILAQLHGAKPEYTGVVAGMSGSPVYIGNRLLGSLSYRIGQFSKDPIAGITPIEQMLEVRDLPMRSRAQGSSGIRDPAEIPGSVRSPPARPSADGMNFQAMETPLVMSGFRPKRFGCGSSRWPAPAWRWLPPAAWDGSSSVIGESAMNAEPSAAKALATWCPARRSARNWCAATWRLRPPAPSPTSTPSSCWPAAIPSCRPARFRCP
jgi:hypothetical protein